VKLGLYFDLRNPAGTAAGWRDTYASTLELCEEGERLGADSIWLSEHHGFADGYLPQPLTFAAAVAARTTRVRIGTAVLLAPIRQAAQIAEEAAVVDQTSGGRLDLGLGAGYRRAEFELFDATFDRRRSTTAERAREVRRLWEHGLVTPPPFQARMPIWLGFAGPQGARRAGLLGEGLLSSNPDLAQPYLEGFREGGHDLDRAQMAGPIYVLVTEDPERDWAAVAPHLAYQRESYARYARDDAAEVPPIDPERLRSAGLGPSLGHFLVATPEEAAVEIRAYIGDAPVETIFVWASIGGMPQALAARHVEVLCRGLAPRLRQAPDPS
jgi:alkanesulfonate monooxygenase SsuD/methylene tetrahydromethanopterin reductase-like flavin-dependent oxidoreductase (luciferase family)